jgi:hypothetical protein
MLVEETKDRGTAMYSKSETRAAMTLSTMGKQCVRFVRILRIAEAVYWHPRKDALTASLLVPVTIHDAKLPIHATGQRERSSCGSDITIPMLHSRAEHVIPKGRHFARTHMSHHYPPRISDIVLVVARCIFNSPNGHLRQDTGRVTLPM